MEFALNPGDAVLAAAEGFAAGDLYPVGIVFGGVALFAAVVALSQQPRYSFTAATVYLVLGSLLAAALSLLGVELLDPFEDAQVIERLTEIAVIVALFSAGLKLDRSFTWRGWRAAAVLLAVVMPLTIAAVAAFAVGVMGLSLGAAIILGAVLAPTDPVLAGDVQVGPPGEGPEPEPKFALTAEAGLNDGLAFPFVLLGIFVAGEGGTDWVTEWVLADVVYATVVGVLIGAGVGRALSQLVAHLRSRGVFDRGLDGWLALATVLVLYGATEFVGAYGFLAAFAGGLAFRRRERHHELHERVHGGSETIEQVAELSVVLVLGSTVTLSGLGQPGLAGYALVACLLFAIRPLVTVLALRPFGVSLAERAFIGWFGIRGIGSFYYVAVVLGAGVLSRGEAEAVYWTVVACTGISIVLHGFTATPVVRRLRL